MNVTAIQQQNTRFMASKEIQSAREERKSDPFSSVLKDTVKTKETSNDKEVTDVNDVISNEIQKIIDAIETRDELEQEKINEMFNELVHLLSQIESPNDKVTDVIDFLENYKGIESNLLSKMSEKITAKLLDANEKSEAVEPLALLTENETANQVETSDDVLELLQKVKNRIPAAVFETSSHLRNGNSEGTVAAVQSSDSSNEMIKPALPLTSEVKSQHAIFVPTNNKEASSAEIAKNIYDILHKSNFQRINGTKKLTIRLFPENLGSLRIELIEDGSTFVAKILTSSGKTKELLESSLPLLQHILTQNQTNLSKIEVNEAFTFLGDEKKKQSNESQEEQSSGEEVDEGISFEDILLERA